MGYSRRKSNLTEKVQLPNLAASMRFPIRIWKKEGNGKD